MSKTALIADPNGDRFAVYEKLLAEIGLTATWAQDGARALSVLRRQANVRLLVTELSLPELDGFELLRHVPSTPNAGLPVIVACAFRELRESASSLRETLGIRAVLTASSGESALRRVFARVLAGGAEPSLAVEPTPRPEDVERRNASAATAAKTGRASATEAELQATVERVARELGVPSAYVSVILREKQWYRTRVGFDAEETTVESSFCRHVVEAKEPLFVPDATTHPTFMNNPHVLAKAVRGYAGAPLVGSDGEAWGTLCVFDAGRPVRLTFADLRRLEAIARQVVAEIEGRPAGPRQGEAAPQLDAYKRRVSSFLTARREE